MEFKKDYVPSSIQHLFDIYESRVMLWHRIVTFPNIFGPSNARFYMESELMIRQELHETAKAFNGDNAKEVLDGILDVYWEVIPVYNYFLNLYKYWVHHGYEPVPCDNLRDEFLVLVRGFTKLDLSYHHDESCAIKMIFRLKLLCENLLEQLFDSITVEAAMESVINSNFSKFVYEPSQEAATTIAANTSEALGETIYINWALIADAGSPDVITYLILRDANGKVRKPEGFFVKPHIEVSSEDKERVKKFWTPVQESLDI